MNKLLTTLRLPFLVFAFSLSSVFCYQLIAGTGMFAEPTAVATVNLQQVFQGLQEQADWQKEIASQRQSIQEQGKKRDQNLQSQLNSLKEITDKAQRRKAEDRIRQDMLEGRAWLEFKLRSLDQDLALRTKLLYEKIRDASAVLARGQGYDLVLVNDAVGPIEWSREAQEPAQLQVLKQISQRRVLFNAEKIDISNLLIDRMNNAYRSGS